MNNNYYNISYSRLAVLLLPPFLRKPLILAFLYAIMRPLDNQHREFTSYMGSIETFVCSQICYIQGLLNDNFDYYDRRIRVRNSLFEIHSFLLWTRLANKPHLLPSRSAESYSPYLLSMRGFIGSQNSDFDIVLPKGFELSDKELNVLKGLINANKLASKTYQIVYE